MDLVLHQVMELHHVHHADRDRVREGCPRAAVVEKRLTGVRQACLLEEIEDFFLGRPVEDGRTHVDALRGLPRHPDEVVVTQRIHDLGGILADVFAHPLAQGLDVGLGAAVTEALRDLLAENPPGPAEVCFEDLPDVHSRRHAERIQHDVDRHAVLHEWHVLFRAGSAK